MTLALLHPAPRQQASERLRRRIERAVAGTVLAVQSGALAPLLVMAGDGSLDGAALSRLRLVSLACYLTSAGLLLAAPRGSVTILRRNPAFCALLLLALVSCLWSIAPGATVKGWVGLLGSNLLSLHLALRYSPDELRRLISAVLLTLLGLSLVMAGLVPRLAFMPTEGDLRGVFYAKNSLGWAAALGVIFAICNLSLSRGTSPRTTPRAGVLGLPLLALSGACLALAGSMTGILSLAAAAGFGLLIRSLARTRGLARSLIWLLTVQSAAVTGFLLTELLVPLLDALGRDATLTGRIPLWHLVDAAIATRPLLGAGFEAFWTPGSDAAWGIWAAIGWNAPHSHMGYREVLLALGLPGALLLGWMLWRGLAGAIALHLAQPAGGWLWIAVLIGTLLIMNLTENLFLAKGDLPWILAATGILMVGRGVRPSG